MKKKLACYVLTAALLFALSIPSFALDSGAQVKNYTAEEITQYAQEYTDRLWLQEFDSQSNSANSAAYVSPRGSFYTETLIRYIPDYAVTKLDAFPLQTFTYDRTGQPESVITIEYTSSTSVEWTITGAAKASTNFSILKQGISAEVSVEVAQSSTTTNVAGTTVPYTLGDGIYSITIYAHGITTTGAFEYYWTDIDGNSGYRTEPITALLPYAIYETTGIHFGPAINLEE